MTSKFIRNTSTNQITPGKIPTIRPHLCQTSTAEIPTIRPHLCQTSTAEIPTIRPHLCQTSIAEIPTIRPHLWQSSPAEIPNVPVTSTTEQTRNITDTSAEILNKIFKIGDSRDIDKYEIGASPEILEISSDCDVFPIPYENRQFAPNDTPGLSALGSANKAIAATPPCISSSVDKLIYNLKTKHSVQKSATKAVQEAMANIANKRGSETIISNPIYFKTNEACRTDETTVQSITHIVGANQPMPITSCSQSVSNNTPAQSADSTHNAIISDIPKTSETFSTTARNVELVSHSGIRCVFPNDNYTAPTIDGPRSQEKHTELPKPGDNPPKQMDQEFCSNLGQEIAARFSQSLDLLKPSQMIVTINQAPSTQVNQPSLQKDITEIAENLPHTDTSLRTTNCSKIRRRRRTTPERERRLSNKHTKERSSKRSCSSSNLHSHRRVSRKSSKRDSSKDNSERRAQKRASKEKSSRSKRKNNGDSSSSDEQSVQRSFKSKNDKPHVRSPDHPRSREKTLRSKLSVSKSKNPISKSQQKRKENLDSFSNADQVEAKKSSLRSERLTLKLEKTISRSKQHQRKYISTSDTECGDRCSTIQQNKNSSIPETSSSDSASEASCVGITHINSKPALLEALQKHDIGGYDILEEDSNDNEDYTCPVCERWNETWGKDNLSKHLQSKHGMTNLFYRCFVCGHDFLKTSTFRKHLSAKHDVTLDADYTDLLYVTVRPFRGTIPQCKNCGYQSHSQQLRREHPCVTNLESGLQVQIHNVDDLVRIQTLHVAQRYIQCSDIPQLMERDIGQDSDLKYMLRCPFCPCSMKLFGRYWDYNNHLKTAHNMHCVIYRCFVCGHEETIMKDLATHLRTSHNIIMKRKLIASLGVVVEPFSADHAFIQCDHCGLLCVRNKYMKIHICGRNQMTLTEVKFQPKESTAQDNKMSTEKKGKTDSLIHDRLKPRIKCSDVQTENLVLDDRASTCTVSGDHRTSQSATSHDQMETRTITLRDQTEIGSNALYGHYIAPQDHTESASIAAPHHIEIQSIAPRGLRESQANMSRDHVESPNVTPLNQVQSQNIASHDKIQSHSIALHDQLPSSSTMLIQPIEIQSIIPHSQSDSDTNTPRDHLESQSVTPHDQIQSRNSGPRNHIQSRNIASLDEIQSRGIAPGDQIENRSIAPRDQIESRSIAPRDQIESRIVTPRYQIENRSIAPRDQIESRSIAPRDQIESLSITPRDQINSLSITPRDQTESPSSARLDQIESKSTTLHDNIKTLSNVSYHQIESRSMASGNQIETHSVTPLDSVDSTSSKTQASQVSRQDIINVIKHSPFQEHFDHSFAYRFELETNQRMKAKPSQVCPVCKQRYSPKELLEHTKRKHGLYVIVYRCYVCGQDTYPYVEDILKHLRKHNLELDQSAAAILQTLVCPYEKIPVCEQCGFQTTSDEIMLEHSC